MTADEVPLADKSERSTRRLLAGRLREARVRAGLSQTQLAELLNVTQSGVGLYEAGERSIGADLLWECSCILNRTRSYFSGESAEGRRFPRTSEIAQMIEGLEQHDEDISELRAYVGFLRDRGPDRHTPRG